MLERWNGAMDWWGDRGPLVRYCVALVLLAGSAAAFYAGRWRGGAVFGAIGLALLLTAGPSDSEKKGYHF